MANSLPESLSKFYLQDVRFANLMLRRIYHVLIVANPYDAFMLEDDGRIEEKIYNEYVELGLRYPPMFIKASTHEEARHILQTVDVDLVICMPGNADGDAFDVARAIKKQAPQLPCVVLTPFSHGITGRMQDEDLSIFDYIFCWLGNTNLILSIIKLIEDKMNIENDIREAGVQMILLVEDSIRFYSSILPNLYSYILTQSRNFATEALTRHEASLRQRGRPKVMLACSYDEAWSIYNRYKENCLGVISDVRFPISVDSAGTNKSAHAYFAPKDADAGFKLLRAIRQQDEYVPLIIESAENRNRARAEAEGFHFVDKNSKKMSVDLRRLLEEHMGFGDFIFRDPATRKEVMRIPNLKALQDNIFKIPRDSMLYHVSRNHVSRWLSARAIFPVSAFLKGITWHKLHDVDKHRQIIFDAIVQYRHMKNLGVVALFDKNRFDKYAHFARIGDGSLGGKGRGLAFLDNIIKLHADFQGYENAVVRIPKTVVLCTDIFDTFMEQNNLYPIALSDLPDSEILQAFLKAQLPDTFIDDFFAFFEATTSPIAVRSSSLLEDSHYQPFAGIYSTYMIPFLDDRREMLRMLACAIKAVYASVYYKASKAYMMATSNVIDQEKMAVVLQQVVGTEHEKRFYPTMSGVLRSLNYYPIGNEKTDEGVVSLALGLGKYIVDGGQSLRFSPYHPHHILQLSELKTTLRETQTRFYALDMAHVGQAFEVDDGFNILKLPVREAEKDGTLRYIASTYLPNEGIVFPGVQEDGRKIISFDGVLQQGVFPLAELLKKVMNYGVEAMKRPVEIEFAVNLSDDRTGELYLLQVRPIADSKQSVSLDFCDFKAEDCLLQSNHALGHGVVSEVCDVVYVKTSAGYSPLHHREIAEEIARMNEKLLKESAPYLLIGPGRWGSSDPWLGIPVSWADISGAKVIVEEGLEAYNVDPSQGTHFFQNLTSFGVGYLTVNNFTNDGYFRQELLETMPAVFETRHVRHVRFKKNLRVLMDGRKQEAVVMLR